MANESICGHTKPVWTTRNNIRRRSEERRFGRSTTVLVSRDQWTFQQAGSAIYPTTAAEIVGKSELGTRSRNPNFWIAVCCRSARIRRSHDLTVNVDELCNR